MASIQQMMMGGGSAQLLSTWTDRSSTIASDFPNGIYIGTVVRGGGKFLAVGGAYASAGRAVTSTDGVTWSSSNINSVAPDWQIRAIWTGSKFISAGYNGAVAQSTDGVTWTAMPSLGSMMFDGTSHRSPSGFCLGSGKLVCVTSMASGIDVGGCLTSTNDGANWTRQASFPAAMSGRTPNDIAYSGSLFVVVGQGGYAATSADAVTWSNLPALSAMMSGTEGQKALYSVIWTGSQFVVSGQQSTGLNFCATSPDGINWTEQFGFPAAAAGYLCMHNGMIVCSGLDSPAKLVTSSDGVSWNENLPFGVAVTGRSMGAIASDNSTLVAAGSHYSGGTIADLFTSP